MKFISAALMLAMLGCYSWTAEAHGRKAIKPKFDPRFVNEFWNGGGARLPGREFVEAVQAASLTVTDGRGRQRRLVLLSLVSEFALSGSGLWELFLGNLRNITFSRREGSQDHLANHLVARLMTMPNATATHCNRLSNRFGARCVPMASPIFNADNYGYKTSAYYGLSFVKVLTILDALTIGVDAFFLDSDQVFFRNPLPYMLARDIDVLVTGDCGARDDETPSARFPKINSNIGLLYFRSTPMVTRAVNEWLFYLVRKARDRRPVLDQGTFVGAMETISTDVGAQRMSVAMLIPDFFPHRCMSPCGCDTEGLSPGQLGRKLYRTEGSACQPLFVRKWYHFHVPCNGDMNSKATTLQKLLRLYQGVVGPVNSLSDPFDAL
ncbi:hypothetical protein VaNZ11_015963 [Volvox africanus]|uniref:Nucleotide-diphospho-sugar transferase domain-containing protein n=1 Tax=Volvox africanus TaxID=51714 RepID=A0ABQ5SNV4_9CHLO|nr:hypothetical protein VaNZ11_015963 [Volvox africanus]